MSTQVQYRRGTATENNAFTGALAEITVDTTNKTLRVHDGTTAGGSNIATVAYVNTQISSLSSNSITDGTSNVKVFNNGNVAVTVGGSANVLIVTSTGANIAGTLNATGNANVGNLGATTVVASTLTGTLSTAAQTNITSLGTLSSLTVTANITGGNLTTAGIITVNSGGAATAIVNGGSNGVGNIGSSTTYFNTVFAKATSAQYADLAEKYLADADYPVGTVLVVGGTAEVTQSSTSHSSAAIGTVSDKPSYIMNSGLAGDHVATVALLGRVPCRVKGPISKGDLVVSSDIMGVAEKLDSTKYVPGCVIGKSLGTVAANQIETVEIIVGRV